MAAPRQMRRFIRASKSCLRRPAVEEVHGRDFVYATAPPGRPCRRTLMKWITRERPKIDRIACPWLIKRFVDPDAEFLYVPPQRVLEEAARLEAIPYDVPGVELTHDGPLCSFDAILKKYGL